MTSIARDPGTGLIAFEDFLKLLRYDIERSGADPGLCVAHLDLDHFAAHRDVAGEEGAAATLEDFGNHLRAQLGGQAALGFEPADGFWAILPGLAPERAIIRFEDLRRSLAASGFPLTFSAGLSVCPRDGRTEAALVRHARMAAFKAKWAGRDQLVLASTQKMVLKSNYYPRDQLESLARLAKVKEVAESELLREALDLLFARHESALKSPR